LATVRITIMQPPSLIIQRTFSWNEVSDPGGHCCSRLLIQDGDWRIYSLLSRKLWTSITWWSLGVVSMTTVPTTNTTM
jgi:hypothetical protein